MKGLRTVPLPTRQKSFLAKKQVPTKSPPISAGLAAVIERMIVTSVNVKDFDELTAKYPPPKNVTSMSVPPIDAQIKKLLSKNLTTPDDYLQKAQAAIMGAMTAIIPVLELMVDRGEEGDEELNAHGDSAQDCLNLLAFANNTIVRRRREMLRSHIQTEVSQEVMESPMGGPTLFSEAKKVVEATKEEIDFTRKIMKFKKTNRKSSKNYGGHKSHKRSRSFKKNYKKDFHDQSGGNNRGGGSNRSRGRGGGGRGRGRGQNQNKN